MFPHLQEVAGFCEAFVLCGAALLLTAFKYHAFGWHREQRGQLRERFIEACAGFVLLDGRGRGVFLHMQPRLIGLVEIDRERIFRHVRIVKAVTTHLITSRPTPEQAQILLDTIGEHRRTRGGCILLCDALLGTHDSGAAGRHLWIEELRL